MSCFVVFAGVDRTERWGRGSEGGREKVRQKGGDGPSHKGQSQRPAHSAKVRPVLAQSQ